MSSIHASDPPKSGNGSAPSPAARFFLLRTVFALLLAGLLTLVGLFAAKILVKESLPDLAIPQALVTTTWPGADPQTIEREVTNPIEKELKGLEGLKSMTSASFDSFSLVSVEFHAEAELSESMALLRAAVSDAEAELPREAEKPSIRQVSVNDRPVLTLVVLGDLDPAVMGRAVKGLEEELERVPGVNEVKIAGRREEVIRIQLFAGRLRALGLSPTSIREKIQAANLDMPWGEIESDTLGSTVRLYGRFRSVDDLRTLPVARLEGDTGRVVRLEEVADVRRDLERETSRAMFSSEGKPFRPSMEISITKLPGADTVALTLELRKTLEEARQSPEWPHGLDYHVMQDQAERIGESLSGIVTNGFQAMLGVFIVLLVMLTWREGILAGLAIPLTLVGSLSFVWLLGYTLNEIVIIGMVLALGLLVDVFILMMEGIHEAIFVRGKSFAQSALATVKTYALPAAAGQATTILALAPLMAMPGFAGKFIRVMPVTATICLVLSFVIALLVLIPFSRFFFGQQRPGEHRLTRMDRVTALAARTLESWSLETTLKSRGHAGLWVAGAIGLLILAGMAFSTLPQTMYAARDGRQLGITIELPPGTTLATTQRAADRLGELLRVQPEIETVVKLAGKKSPMTQTTLQDSLTVSEGSHIAGFSCMLVPREDRKEMGVVYAERLRHEIHRIVDGEFPGATVQVVSESGKPSNLDPIQVDITGEDMATLRAISRNLQATIAALPGTADVRDTLGPVKAEVRLKPRREAMDFYGVSENDLANQVRLAMADDAIGTYALGGNADDLDIRMGTAWASRRGKPGGPRTLGELVSMRIFARDGSPVPGPAILAPHVGVAPISITHKEGKRSATVMAKTDGRPADVILKDLIPELERVSSTWPPGYGYKVGGEFEESEEAFSSAGMMMGIAILLVFALLVLMFDSFSQPFIILTAIPLALIGTFGGFWLLGMPFSFFAMVGVISLVGIVVNDTIVMVDTMNHRRKEGLDLPTAAARGASERLRPIVTTSVTTIIGLVPLALSDPMWQPLCLAIIFGLMVATVSSLVVTPCLYLLLTRKNGLESPEVV